MGVGVRVHWGQRGAGLKEAHTLICHVLVCLSAQKSARQSPMVTQATVWFNARAMCVFVVVYVCSSVRGNLIMYVYVFMSWL